jgi:hypothetical protein
MLPKSFPELAYFGSSHAKQHDQVGRGQGMEISKKGDTKGIYDLIWIQLMELNVSIVNGIYIYTYKVYIYIYVYVYLANG